LLTLAALHDSKYARQKAELCLLCQFLLVSSELVKVACNQRFIQQFRSILGEVAVNNPHNYKHETLKDDQNVNWEFSCLPSTSLQYAALFETLALYGKNVYLIEYLATCTQDDIARGLLFSRADGKFIAQQDVAATLCTISGLRIPLEHLRQTAAAYGLQNHRQQQLTPQQLIVLTCDDHEGGMMPTAVSPLLSFKGVVNLVIGGDLVGYFTPFGQPGNHGQSLGHKYVWDVWYALTSEPSPVVMWYATGNREFANLDQFRFMSSVADANFRRPNRLVYPVDVEHTAESVFGERFLVDGWCRVRANARRGEIGTWNINEVIERVVRDIGLLFQRHPSGPLTFVLSCHTDIDTWRSLLPWLDRRLWAVYHDDILRIRFVCLAGHDHDNAPKYDGERLALFEVVAPSRNCAVALLNGGGRLVLTVL
jgi:hypothetical protein